MSKNHQIKNPKPSKNMKIKNEIEFCRVCKRNHEEGQRHKYFPKHIKSLSSFLSKFESKISDVRFFLTNPIPLLPELAFQNRLWCVFCDVDIDELDSSFACSGNAISHLASSEHFKCLKSFLWKYGGGMDRLDSFRVSEAEKAKWQKKCDSMMSGDVCTSGMSLGGVVHGPANDIHDKINHENINNFDQNTMYSFESKFSNTVVPLQRYTNENYQVFRSDVSQVAPVGSQQFDGNCHLQVGAQGNLWGLKQTPDSNPVYRDSCHVLGNGGYSADDYANNGRVCQEARMVNGVSSFQGLQTFAQNSSIAPDRTGGNVHSGAHPPWLESCEENETKVQSDQGLGVITHASPLSKSWKSRLNPKRVGAAWAEKRKREMELEKRGEISTNNFDDNWLPDFGRVWQTGSRKESRREFEMEKQKAPKVETQSEASLRIQPYVSKRMRADATQ